jgi:hypothetical protein
VAGQQTVPSLASNLHPVWMIHHNIANNALTDNKNDEKSMKNEPATNPNFQSFPE